MKLIQVHIKLIAIAHDSANMAHLAPQVVPTYLPYLSYLH